MSESVKIGGIGKNPAIDKINSINSIDIKNYAVNKMEQLLMEGDSVDDIVHIREIPINFDKVNWERETNGNK